MSEHGLVWNGVDGRLPLETLEVRFADGKMYRGHGSEEVFEVGEYVAVEVDDGSIAAAELLEILEAEIVVRWLYTVDEIPKKKRPVDTQELRDLFESDHLDRIDPDAIMAKIAVHSTGTSYLCRYAYRCNAVIALRNDSSLRRAGRAEADLRSFGGGLSLRKKKKQKTTDWSQARESLELRNAPTRLPCREKERAELLAFVRDALNAKDGAGRSIYISGLPGTGKTATVKQVVQGFYQDIQFIEINAMRLPSPPHAYSLLWRAISKELISAANAARKLEDYFSSTAKTRKMMIALVDELDYLVTKQETVLYNLFEWPSRKNSNLAIIGIANTMDLPERLEPKVRSRLGCRRLVFKPYNFIDVSAILHNRLADHTKLFETKALELASRKTAAYSGDVRRALQVASRALDLCQHRNGKQVTVQDVQNAFKALAQSSHTPLLSHLSHMEVLVLCAVCLELRSHSLDDEQQLTLDHLSSRLSRIYSLHTNGVLARLNLIPPSNPNSTLGEQRLLTHAELLSVLYRFHDAGLLSIFPNSLEPRVPLLVLDSDATLLSSTLVNDAKHPIAVALLGGSR